jgi:PAS domain-containing protein
VIHRCAWCGRESGPHSDEPDQDFVTHGICPECEEHFDANRPERLRLFLNRFDAPILCVDSAGRVIAANDAAGEMVAKDQDEMAESLVGDLVECRWSRLPAGCGKTDHCIACSIRLLVGETLIGKGNTQGRRAYVDREGKDGRFRRVELEISSERHDHVVLLEFEEIDRE